MKKIVCILLTVRILSLIRSFLRTTARRLLGADDAATAFFRGTSEGFAGSPALQRIGITPASTDPVVATIFATEAENYGRGVVHIASRSDLAGVEMLQGNVLAHLEREVGINILPAEFARRASATTYVLISVPIRNQDKNHRVSSKGHSRKDGDKHSIEYQGPRRC